MDKKDRLKIEEGVDYVGMDHEAWFNLLKDHHESIMGLEVLQCSSCGHDMCERCRGNVYLQVMISSDIALARYDHVMPYDTMSLPLMCPEKHDITHYQGDMPCYANGW